MKFVFSTLILACVSLTAFSQSFTLYSAFPPPVPSGYGYDKGYAGVALPDGRLVIWNGAELYLQDFAQTDSFRLIADGIEGDPGFIVLTPDEQTIVIGEGYGGRIYTIPVTELALNPTVATVATQSHYSGIALTNELLLLDAGKSDFSGSELVTVSLSGAKSMPSVVLRKPRVLQQKDVVVDKPLYSYSSSLYIDRERGLVFVMDGNTRELRSFSTDALVAAHNSGTPLDWEADGTLIGAAGNFFTGGVAGMTGDGLLYIDGSAGYLQPGGIQLVYPRFENPGEAFIVETFDPAGTQGFYDVIVNNKTGGITALCDGQVFATDLKFDEVPAASKGALLLLAAVFILFGSGSIFLLSRI